MHIHIHSLLHFIRHARLLGSSVRLFGAMLLMMLFSLLQFSAGESAAAVFAVKENPGFTFDLCSCGNAVSICEESDSGDSRFRGDGPKHFPPLQALHKNAFSSVFHRLQPRIVMVPRMNRVPKPKSVYRLFTRAPGNNSDEVE